MAEDVPLGELLHDLTERWEYPRPLIPCLDFASPYLRVVWVARPFTNKVEKIYRPYGGRS